MASGILLARETQFMVTKTIYTARGYISHNHINIHNSTAGHGVYYQTQTLSYKTSRLTDRQSTGELILSFNMEILSNTNRRYGIGHSKTNIKSASYVIALWDGVPSSMEPNSVDPGFTSSRVPTARGPPWVRPGPPRTPGSPAWSSCRAPWTRARS